MASSSKDARIVKLYLRGLSCVQIARKMGFPGNIARVIDGLRRQGYDPQSFAENEQSEAQGSEKP